MSLYGSLSQGGTIGGGGLRDITAVGGTFPGTSYHCDNSGLWMER